MDEILTKLDQLIQELKTPALPLSDTLWSAEDVGKYLGVSSRNVTERYATHPKFPRARKPGGGRPRWVASEIIEWAKK